LKTPLESNGVAVSAAERLLGSGEGLQGKMLPQTKEVEERFIRMGLTVSKLLMMDALRKASQL
jgi:hypothetical protein